MQQVHCTIGSDPSDKLAQLGASGQVVTKLKLPWRAGPTNLMMSPQEFMYLLAARKRPVAVCKAALTIKLPVSRDGYGLLQSFSALDFDKPWRGSSLRGNVVDV